jgi:hypothetical protein
VTSLITLISNPNSRSAKLYSNCDQNPVDEGGPAVGRFFDLRSNMAQKEVDTAF